jgi:hypothetical protein
LALLTIGALSFAGGMVTGLGRWAIAVGMQVLIPMVFVLGFPREDFAGALRIEAMLALGGFAYIAFALLATVVTDSSGRRLVASESIREFSIYLRSVAAVFDPNADLAAAYGSAIRQQAALAEQLQSARFLLLNRSHLGSERTRLAATIGVLLDAFDALVASQSDVELIRGSPVAAPILGHIDTALRLAANDLDRLSLELLRSGHPALPPDHRRATDALEHEAQRVVNEGGADPKTLEAIEAVVRRLVLALDHIRRLEKTRSDDKEAAASMSGVDLATFIPKRSYSLTALRSHLTIASPVLRFSVRLALAMMAGAIVAQFLGDAAHGNWVLLTIAVVMRANYGGRHASQLWAHKTAAGRPGHRNPRWLRSGGRRRRLSAACGAGCGAGAFGRRPAQLRAPELSRLVRGSVDQRSGLAPSRPSRSAGASRRASRGYAHRCGDCPPLQLCLAALGVC